MKVLTLNSITYEIDNNNTLVKMSNSGGKCDVFIPHKFYTGERIDHIGRSFCRGVYSKISISPDITDIQTGAFSYAFVDKVRWSSSCLVIPNRCFYFSTLINLDNISNVVQIGDSAFKNTINLKNLDLSDSLVCSIGEDAFDCDDNEKNIVLPYYLCEKIA